MTDKIMKLPFRQIPIYQIEQGCSVPLESKITGTLKTQLSNVALHKHSVVRTTYGKLHAVAALYLKGHIIGRERMRHRIVCMVARNFRSLCHNRCRNSQPRRMVVFIPCADISDDGV